MQLQNEVGDRTPACRVDCRRVGHVEPVRCSRAERDYYARGRALPSARLKAAITRRLAAPVAARVSAPTRKASPSHAACAGGACRRTHLLDRCGKLRQGAGLSR
eukprot:CAMPEP_0170425042 /NCGR_PEP_ID=MMETSP0117_2-20130122/37886_1 /TAXON_ID=400756 /ORGANISM="Durinskia baltica, Strain CSIRO CS-38" /LENGTH=103 /DNA_ID=CAMNT_0010683963 /DNA_START=17 /DNA_END=325 /DNA_ORIENTATION=-